MESPVHSQQLGSQVGKIPQPQMTEMKNEEGEDDSVSVLKEGGKRRSRPLTSILGS